MKNLIFLFLCLVSCNAKNNDSEKLPTSFEGRVVAIKDGDTYNIMYDGKARSIRLAHIDCPEKSQPFGKKAKQFASDICFGQIAKVVGDGKTDRYKRLIAEVYVNNICINKELVKNGLAWHFIKYSDNEQYAELEKQARLNKLGLWADQEPIAPWDWRKK